MLPAYPRRGQPDTFGERFNPTDPPVMAPRPAYIPHPLTPGIFNAPQYGGSPEMMANQRNGMLQAPQLDPEAFGNTQGQMEGNNAYLAGLERMRQAALQRQSVQSGSPMLNAALLASAQGAGPSTANPMFQMQTNQNLQQAAAEMAAGRGGPGNFLGASQGLAQAGGNSALNAAGIGAADQFRGQNMLFDQAQTQAGLDAQQRQLNAEANFGYLDAIQGRQNFGRDSLIRYEQNQAALAQAEREARARSLGAKINSQTQQGAALLGAGAAVGAASLTGKP